MRTCYRPRSWYIKAMNCKCTKVSSSIAGNHKLTRSPCCALTIMFTTCRSQVYINSIVLSCICLSKFQVTSLHRETLGLQVVQGLSQRAGVILFYWRDIRESTWIPGVLSSTNTCLVGDIHEHVGLHNSNRYLNRWLGCEDQNFLC